MKKMDLKAWAELIYIPEKLNLRRTGSKHQRKIREILYLVDQAKDHPRDDVFLALGHVKIINCPDDAGDYVDYCKYLQHCVNVLKDEGITELLVSKE